MSSLASVLAIGLVLTTFRAVSNLLHGEVDIPNEQLRGAVSSLCAKLRGERSRWRFEPIESGLAPSLELCTLGGKPRNWALETDQSSSAVAFSSYDITVDWPETERWLSIDCLLVSFDCDRERNGGPKDFMTSVRLFVTDFIGCPSPRCSNWFGFLEGERADSKASLFVGVKALTISSTAARFICCWKSSCCIATSDISLRCLLEEESDIVTSVFVFLCWCNVRFLSESKKGSSFERGSLAGHGLFEDISVDVGIVLGSHCFARLCGEWAWASKFDLEPRSFSLWNMRAFGQAIPEYSSTCLGACWNEKAITSRNL